MDQNLSRNAINVRTVLVDFPISWNLMPSQRGSVDSRRSELGCHFSYSFHEFAQLFSLTIEVYRYFLRSPGDPLFCQLFLVPNRLLVQNVVFLSAAADFSSTFTALEYANNKNNSQDT